MSSAGTSGFHVSAVTGRPVRPPSALLAPARKLLSLQGPSSFCGTNTWLLGLLLVPGQCLLVRLFGG